MKTINLLIIVSTIIAYSCAVQKAPSGGPPDPTPPAVIHSEPASGSINFQGESISLEFNKWVEKNKVTENVFISPTARMDYNWSGKELEIEFPGGLDSNTTYALTIGTDYQDYYDKNKPSEAYTFIMSTGSKLDSAKISGHLFGEDFDGVYIFAYPLDGINPDTLDPYLSKPKYMTQVGTNGIFELKALKAGLYRLIAVDDKFKNQLIDDGDRFGLPFADVVASNDSITPAAIRIGPALDRSAPAVYGAEALFNNRLVVNFSEDLDFANINPASFVLSDSAETERIDIKYAYLLDGSGKKIEIIHDNISDTTKKWMIRAVPGTDNSIRDTSNNYIADSINSAFFYAVSAIDTGKIVLNSKFLKDSSAKIDRNHVFEFRFNLPVDPELLRNSIALIDMADSSSVGFTIETKSPVWHILHTENEMKNFANYKIEFDNGTIGSSNFYPGADTLYSARFSTSDTRKYAAFSGVLNNHTETSIEKIIIVLQSDQLSNTTHPDKEGNWSFPPMSPGEYSLMIYEDLNENGRYDSGYPQPVEFSEPFMIIKDKISLRARFDVKGYIIDYGK